MKFHRNVPRVFLPAVIIAAVACGGADEGAADSAAPSVAAGSASVGGPRVWISAPAEGDTITGGSVEVKMNVDGVTVVPAAMERVEGQGHLHLFLDRDVTRPDVPIPVDPTIVHLGTGATNHVFTTLSPGAHRIIAVFAYGDHTPMASVATDTVNIIVK